MNMKYISEDGKVFNTEYECLEHEKEIEAEKVRKEKLEKERQDRLNAINRKHKELEIMILEYKKDYKETIEDPYTSFENFIKLLSTVYYKNRI